MIERYEHHGNDVAVVSEYKGKHKDICMCHQGCKHFKPDAIDNCYMAQTLYEFSVMFGGTALWQECSEYDGGEE